ncbi:MAG: cytochrome b [Steroidobacteraceae bacterium]
MRDVRYTRVAIILHWVIAAFIQFNLALGFFMEDLPPPLRFLVLPLHISGGMTVLLLSVMRILWRLIHRPPEHEPPLSLREGIAARFVHLMLYAGMLLMPLSGWAILSAHPAPGTAGFAAEQAALLQPPAGANAGLARKPGPGGIRIWWAMPLPALAPIQKIGSTPGGLVPQKEVHEELVAAHGLGGWIMIALLALHIGAALKHQWVDKSPELRRISLRTS